MGWLASKFQQWSESVQLKEIDYFIESLRAMDGDEIGMVLAVATDRRHRLRDLYGWDLMDPIVLMTAQPEAAVKLVSLVKEMQSRKALPVAAGLMVWLHTLRATNTQVLRGRGRLMWGQLSRGMPHLFDGAQSWFNLSGELLNVDEGNQFPEGLSPTPR